MLESPVAQLARHVERAPPDDRRRNGPLALPPLRHIGAGGVDCSGDLRLGRGRKTALPIERPERALQRHVHEIAEFQRIEHQGVFAAFRRAPAQAVPPRETQWIAQQLTQRARRLGTFDDGAQHGVVGPYQAVVRRQLLAPPVSPAAMCGPGLSRGSKLAGPRGQSVGLAESMFRHGIARQVRRGRMLTNQDAATQEPPVTVAPGAGEDDLTPRGCQDGREVSPVGVTDRQRLELGSGNDVIGEEAVLRDSARPARGVESEQAHVAAGGSGERARGHPGGRDARVGAVVELERLQREVEGSGGAVAQRPAPDRERPSVQEGLSRLFGRIDAVGQGRDDPGKGRTMIVAVRPVGGAQPFDQASPRLARGERRVGRQQADPPRRKCLEGAGQRRQERVQASNPALRQTPQHDVRQRGGGLSLPAGGDLDAVREAEVEIGVPSQGQEVVVVVVWRDGRDGDVGRFSGAGANELPRPAQRLDGFVVGRRSTCHDDLRFLRRLSHDLNRSAVEPRWNPPGSRDPANRHSGGDRVQHGPPAGR